MLHVEGSKAAILEHNHLTLYLLRFFIYLFIRLFVLLAAP